jgi:hypothetical protein
MHIWLLSFTTSTKLLPTCCACAQLEALRAQQNSRQGELTRAQAQLEKARRVCEVAQQKRE